MTTRKNNTPLGKKLSIDINSGPPQKIGIPSSISPGALNSNSKKMNSFRTESDAE